jgi:hypothetical protein
MRHYKFNDLDIFEQIFEEEDDCPERLSCVIHDFQLVIKDSKKGCTAIDNFLSDFSN